jgi:hypothetical protein
MSAKPAGDGEPALGSFDQMTDQRHSWRQRDGAGFYLDAKLLTQLLKEVHADLPVSLEEETA